MPLGRRLVRGAAASVLMTIISMLLSVANSVLLGRMLGPGGYGIYSFALLAVGVLTSPFWYGMSTLLTRETGQIMAAGTRRDMAALLRWSYGLIVCVAVAEIVAGALLLRALADRLGTTWSGVGAVMLPLIILLIVMQLNATVLRAVGGLVRSQFCDLILRPGLVLVILMGTLVVLGSSSITARAGLVAQGFAVAIASCVSAIWIGRGWRDVPLERPPQAVSAPLGNRWPSLMTFLAFGTGLTLYSSIDSLLLSALDGHAALGVYRIALVATQMIAGFIAAINTITLPSISRLHAEGDRGRLQRLVTWSARVTLALVAVPVLVLTVLATPLLRFGFGDAFAVGGPALAITALSQLAATAAGPATSVLNFGGHEQAALYCLLIGAITNGLLCLAFIPSFGITGAALAAAAGTIVMNALLSWTTHRLTGLNCTAFSFR